MSDAFAFLVASMFDQAAWQQRECARRQEADAETLLAWLRTLEALPSLKMLGQRAPLPLRNRQRREPAIALLLRQGKVRRERQGRATVLVPT